MIQDWPAFPAGMVIATVVMIVGLGGGILWMPFLILFLKMDMKSAVVTSMLIQIAGTGSGAAAYLGQNKVDIRLGLLMLVFAVPGILLGTFISHHTAPANVELVLGILTTATAFLFVSSGHKYLDTGNERAEIRKAYKYSWSVALIAVGSGMLSTNVGEWLIPVMRNKLSLKMSNSVATCIFITCGISVIGSLSHLFAGGRPDLSVVMWGIPGVIIGGQIGPQVSKRIDERLLKEIFVFVLTLIGIHLIYNAY